MWVQNGACHARARVGAKRRFFVAAVARVPQIAISGALALPSPPLMAIDVQMKSTTFTDFLTPLTYLSDTLISTIATIIYFLGVTLRTSYVFDPKCSPCAHICASHVPCHFSVQCILGCMQHEWPHVWLLSVECRPLHFHADSS